MRSRNRFAATIVLAVSFASFNSFTFSARLFSSSPLSCSIAGYCFFKAFTKGSISTEFAVIMTVGFVAFPFCVPFPFPFCALTDCVGF